MFIRKSILSTLVGLAILAACPTEFAQAKKQKSVVVQKKTTQNDSVATARANLLKATADYKESLQKLTAIYESNVKEEQDRVEKLKELYSQGILSKRELEAAETKAAELKANLESSRKQIAQADDMIAESEAIGSDDTPIANGKIIQTPAFLRFNGTAKWTLSESAMVGGFFLKKFGHSMPISAYGQTGVHDKLGFDHRNSMDVALNPDSAEGQALMAYLKQSGIPFIAFRRAVPGSATGAHIHVGYPSHRISASDSSH